VTKRCPAGLDKTTRAHQPAPDWTGAPIGTAAGCNRAWLSSGVVRGQTFLRMGILSRRSRAGRIVEALEIIAAAAAD
jgi:hypothetical protein